jgi:hypothetical protein
MAKDGRQARTRVGGTRRVVAGLPFDAHLFRRQLRDALRHCPIRRSGAFREVRVAGAQSTECGSVCLALPSGVRVEGLDVAGAAALLGLIR